MNTIILEGPDGAGKTTLARELEKRYYKYIHNDVPERDLDQFKIRLDMLISNPCLKVIDRLHLSERIYEPVMRGSEPQLTELQERLIERYLNARGGQVVICLPPWRTVLNNWLKNQENEYVDNPDKLFQIWKKYLDLKFSGRPYLHYDYTQHEVESFAHCLSITEKFQLPQGMVGMPNARFLFVGEVCNGPVDTPFLSDKNSSGYLHGCLDEAGYEEHELAFANAFSVRDRIPYKFDSAATWSIIALGNVAFNELTRQGIQPSGLLAHPAHWMRFHASERQTYVDKLAKIRRETP